MINIYYTKVLTACRKARDSKSDADLKRAAALLASRDFDLLSPGQQVNLASAYAAAEVVQKGAFT